MNRRGFLRSLFASTATIVVAPACVLDDLPPLGAVDPHRVYFDMGRNSVPVVLDARPVVYHPFGIMAAIIACYRRPRRVAQGAR